MGMTGSAIKDGSTGMLGGRRRGWGGLACCVSERATRIGSNLRSRELGVDALGLERRRGSKARI